MVDVVTLKAGAVAILNALGTFRFLTPQQMVTAGAANTASALYPLLKELVTKPRPLAGKIDFGSLPGQGRLSTVYHLTARGAEVLADSGRPSRTIAVPKRVRFFAKDYFHRVQCVDMHIAVTQMAERLGARLPLYATYYAQGTKTSEDDFAPKTTVKWPKGQLTADAVFELAGPDAHSRLCFLELHRGDDARRIKGQINAYMAAVAWEALETAFDYDHAARILIVFEDPGTLARTLKWFGTNLSDPEAAERFYFNDLASFCDNPMHGWWKLAPDGTPRDRRRLFTPQPG